MFSRMQMLLPNRSLRRNPVGLHRPRRRAKVRFLIADEVSGMLDTITQAAIWHALLEHAAEALVGILAISHDSALLARICDRVMLLDKGTICDVDRS